MDYIDHALNKFTIYKVVLYLLLVLLTISIVLSFLKVLPFDPLLMLQNSLIIFVSCWVFNFIFSKLFKAATNSESVFITAAILCLILPIQFLVSWYIFVFASLVSQGGKYVFTYKKRHIFNPAALGVFLTGLFFSDAVATWWVGNPILFSPVLIIGFLILRKTKRFSMVFSFLGVYLTLYTFILFSQGLDFNRVINNLFANITGSALIFFATVMLTEPLTSPATRRLQVIYAFIVAALYSSSLLSFPGAIMTAGLSLLFGNIFAFLAGPKYRFSLSLSKMTKLTQDLYLFEFKKPKNFNFKPGQYMEWTLPHKKTDMRGNRRYFSIASSPTENTIMVSFRLYNPSSSFKKTMVKMKEKEKIIAANLSGDFVLPNNFNTPLAFIAGGIGITPFRSMLKFISGKKIKVDIVLLYVVKKKEDIIFFDMLRGAKKIGVKIIPIVGKYELEEKDFTENISDYKNRIFYISGPQPMVQNFKHILKKIKVKGIKTDFFPGY